VLLQSKPVVTSLFTERHAVLMQSKIVETSMCIKWHAVLLLSTVGFASQCTEWHAVLLQSTLDDTTLCRMACSAVTVNNSCYITVYRWPAVLLQLTPIVTSVFSKWHQVLLSST
jgi:hypothetical protein